MRNSTLNFIFSSKDPVVSHLYKVVIKRRKKLLFFVVSQQLILPALQSPNPESTPAPLTRLPQPRAAPVFWGFFLESQKFEKGLQRKTSTRCPHAPDRCQPRGGARWARAGNSNPLSPLELEATLSFPSSGIPEQPETQEMGAQISGMQEKFKRLYLACCHRQTREIREISSVNQDLGTFP